MQVAALLVGGIELGHQLIGELLHAVLVSCEYSFETGHRYLRE